MFLKRNLLRIVLAASILSLGFAVGASAYESSAASESTRISTVNPGDTAFITNNQFLLEYDGETISDPDQLPKTTTSLNWDPLSDT